MLQSRTQSLRSHSPAVRKPETLERCDPEVRNIGRGQIKLRMLGVHPHVRVLFDFSSFEMVETNRNPKRNGSFQSRSFLQACAVRNGVAQLCVCVSLR